MSAAPLVLGRTYIVYTAAELKRIWPNVKSGDAIVLMIPDKPEDYGFEFQSDAARLQEPELENDWHGCCC